MNSKKVYNSVVHVALWEALGKLSVPDMLIDFVRSFNNNIKVKLSVDGEFLGLELENGLQQGCTILRIMFNPHML